MKTIRKLIIFNNPLLSVGLILLLSIGLHSVHIDHNHPHGLIGDGIQAVFHGENKNWWAVLTSIFLSLFVAALFKTGKGINFSPQNVQRSYLYSSLRLAKIFDPLCNALSDGILHPKICG